MFNSFLDGSKPAIETTAVCNATGLTPAPRGTALSAGLGRRDSDADAAEERRRRAASQGPGRSDLFAARRTATPIPYDIRFGVFVVFEGETEYIRRCFNEYGVKTDPSGRYACLYKRWHLIGLEVGISVASVGLRGEPTGCADRLARRRRRRREERSEAGRGAGRRGRLHGGRAADAGGRFAGAGLPAAGPRARLEGAARPVAAGQPVKWSDVAFDANKTAVRVRREMESAFGARAGAAAEPVLAGRAR